MKNNVSRAMTEMIVLSKGELHDINHFLKVHAYAGLIAEREHLSQEDREVVEIAAIIHDIACPLCREKYGNTNGKLQEKEGAILAVDFLKDFDMTQGMKNRIVYLVGHHHSPADVDGTDYQIILEADYLVNADEQKYSPENIRNTMETMFRTASGKELLKSVYQVK